jgi:hypothetical protein
VSWWVVTCRLAFQDEDSLFIREAATWEEATDAIEADMREEADATEKDDEGEYRREFYVNHVVRCDAPPTVAFSNV